MKRNMISQVVSALAVCFIALVSPRVQAQNAPAGNAHPASRDLSEVTGSSPFGPPVAATMDAKQKYEFAKAVDVKPLRDLAVFHDGRLKILDTLARETIKQIAGRKDYVDWVRTSNPTTPESTSGGEYAAASTDGEKKVKFDPVFTFFDLIIDPDYYAKKPLVHVDYLPLREAFLDASGLQGNEREWWLKLGRLKPSVVSQNGAAISTKYQFNEGYRKGLMQLAGSMSLFRDSWQNLLLIAPTTKEDKWDNLSVAMDGSRGVALKTTVNEFAAAWRAGDAAKVNAAIKSLAEELPKINSSTYPTTRREVERLYNASNPFEWGYWMYCLALVTLLLAFGTGRKTLVGIGVLTLTLAIGLHLFGFASRCYIAERVAIQNQFESMTGLSLGAALVGFVLMLARRQWLFGAAAAGVGFMVLITATQTGIPGQVIEREAPILNTSVLLKYHVTTVLVSYGLIALGFMVSLFYLGTYYAAKWKAQPMMAAGAGAAAAGGGDALIDVSASALGLDESAPKGPQRILSDLDKAQMIILQLAFWTLGTGILLGAWWADHSWGRWWAFDPKELWALITWIVYLIVIHIRFVVKDRAWWTAILSIVGFIVMLWTYFGVNLLLPGLHAYA